MKIQKKLALLAATLSLTMMVALAGTSFSVAAAPKHAANEPCTVPEDVGSIGLAPIGGQTIVQVAGIPAGTTSGNLIITCLQLDQSHYVEGENWSTTLLVTNIGSALSESFTIHGEACRFRLTASYPSPIFTCQISPVSISVQPPLGSGQSRIVQTNSYHFGNLPPDLNPDYDSFIPGVPENGSVYVRASIGNQQMVAEAIYPSAPNNTFCHLNLSGSICVFDEDGDGWYTNGVDPVFEDGEDCDDNQPNVHPFANEVAGNGIDDDCEGGDIGLFTPEGCSEPVEVYYSQWESQSDICSGPPNTGSIFIHDMDGDGFNFPSISTPEDCVDTNSIIFPGAPELNDGLDNNCNGLIDEFFGTPDWAVTLYNVTPDFEGYLPNYFVAGLRYLVEIANLGNDTGDDLSIIENNVWQLNNYVSPAQVESFGLEGFIPYSQLNLGGGNYPPCSGYSPLAMIPMSGLYGETNFGNNVASVNLNSSGAADRSLGFGSPPVLNYTDNDHLSIDENIEITGSCPPLPVNSDGDPVIRLRERVIYKDVAVFDSTVVRKVAAINSGLSNLSIQGSASLKKHDIVCVEIALDPEWHVGEDHSDNYYYQAWELKKPVFAANYFEKIWEVTSITSIATWPADFDCDVPSAEGALIAGGNESSDGLIFDPSALLAPVILRASEDCPTPTPETQVLPAVGQNEQNDPQLRGDDPCEAPGDKDQGAESPPGLVPVLCLIGPECVVFGVATLALMGALLFGLAGFSVGRLAVRKFPMTFVIQWSLILPATVVSVAAGYVIGAAVQSWASPSQGRRGVLAAVSIQDSGLPSCDAFLDPNTASPSNFAVFEATGLISPMTSPIQLEIDLLPDNLIPLSNQFLVVIASPGEQNGSLFISYSDSDALDAANPPLMPIEAGASISVNLRQAMIDSGSASFFSQPGDYEWHIAFGQSATGGDLVAFQKFCQGSALHTFSLVFPPTPTSTPTNTATATPTATLTPTITLTPTVTNTPRPPTNTPVPVDNQSPKVSGASASPNPALTTSPVTISANISDPSGVDNALVYYRTGKNAYQLAGPMKAGGGNSYTLNIGSLVPAGSYDFRILASDNLGNANCNSGNVSDCSGGTFQVNIP